MAVTHLGRSLLYGGLVFGAFACDALAKLSHDHVWFGGSLSPLRCSWTPAFGGTGFEVENGVTRE